MSELRNRHLDTTTGGTAPATWPTIGAPPARPPVLEGPLPGLVSAAVFFASLLALPGLLISAPLGGGIALGCLAVSLLRLNRRASGRGLTIAAVCLGSVGVVLAVVVLLLAPSNWVTTLIIN